MRLHFPNGQHPETRWSEGRLSIGSADSCRVRLADAQANHAWIDADAVRGLELQVAAGAEVHVNGRAVKEKALLRLGDHVLIGAVPLMIKADADQRELPPNNPDFSLGAGFRNLAARSTLRAVAGEFYGKVIGLKTRTTIGRGPECDLVLNDSALARQHAVLESTTHGVYLRDLGSASGTLVNGVSMRDAVLKPGDQLVFESNRFILEGIGASVLEGMMPTPLSNPAMPTQPTPPDQTPIHTQVNMRPIVGQPVGTRPADGSVPRPSYATPVPPNASAELPTRTHLLANIIMLLAAIAAIAGLIWGIQAR